MTDDAAAAVYSINRLKPDALCFVLPEGGKAAVESAVQPKIERMPRRWDWIRPGPKCRHWPDGDRKLVISPHAAPLRPDIGLKKR